MQELIRFLKEKKEALLVILTTYASGWVENSMISKVGNLAFSVSGFLKVKELPFSAMRKIFSDYTVTGKYFALCDIGRAAGTVAAALSAEFGRRKSDPAAFTEEQLSAGAYDKMAVGGIAGDGSL